MLSLLEAQINYIIGIKLLLPILITIPSRRAKTENIREGIRLENGEKVKYTNSGVLKYI